MQVTASQRVAIAPTKENGVEEKSDALMQWSDQQKYRSGCKNCRCKRLEAIPGWFDRWDFFHAHQQINSSIDSLENGTNKAACRRQVVRGIALHACAITGVTSLLRFAPPITDIIQATSLGSSEAKYGLAVGTAVELFVLKLTLDIPIPRRIVFAAYTFTIALLFVTTSIALQAPYAVLCLGLVAADWCLRWWLYGVRINGVFLNNSTITGIPLVLVIGTLIWQIATTTDTTTQRTLALGIAGELLNAVVGMVEVGRLYETVAPLDAALGVYFLNLDLLVILVVYLPVSISYVVVIAVLRVVRWLWKLLVVILQVLWGLLQCLSIAQLSGDLATPDTA